MDGNGDRAFGVGLPDTGKVSVSEGNCGAKAWLRFPLRSMMGGN